MMQYTITCRRADDTTFVHPKTYGSFRGADKVASLYMGKWNPRYPDVIETLVKKVEDGTETPMRLHGAHYAQDF